MQQSGKKKHYRILSTINISKKSEKQKKVTLYENGALFSYADLHSKILSLFLVLPSERFGNNGEFFQETKHQKIRPVSSLPLLNLSLNKKKIQNQSSNFIFDLSNIKKDKATIVKTSLKKKSMVNLPVKQSFLFENRLNKPSILNSRKNSVISASCSLITSKHRRHSSLFERIMVISKEREIKQSDYF